MSPLARAVLVLLALSIAGFVAIRFAYYYFFPAEG